jgi:ribonuclease HII
MLICGVDEAGKGPVLGSLVICGVVIDETELHKLRKMDVKDSKLLKPEERNALYNRIIKAVKDYKLVVIEPKEIDDAILNSAAMNLNKLEAIKTAQMISELLPDKAYIDCPDVVPDRYKQLLLKNIAHKPELVVEHKAEKYAVVAAASILAKVFRDRKIDELKKIHKIDFGSGYCSDPKTKEFMKKYWDDTVYSHIIRKSWATFQNEKIKNEQKTLGSF